MDATDITAYRTGAAAAIAARYLARRDAHTMGIVGAGRQAKTQLLAHAALFDLKEVRVFDLREGAVTKFIKSVPDYPVRAASLAETAAADIICTITTARQPFLKREWLSPGAHINAIGADAAGKEELEPAVLSGAIVVVDDLEQASHGGEINVPVRDGRFRIEDVYATLGEIVTGKKPGRQSDTEMTVFDATGLAIQDIAVARLVYQKAKLKGGYLELEFVEW
jgi:alanine dehydrogenase